MDKQKELWLEEIIVDNFAGGGGASTGIEQAIGRAVDIAINHDQEAISMHEVNHPKTKHYCESVWDVDPKKITYGLPVGLAWFSPDCKHFSKARGGVPVEKKIRGLAWVAIRWAATVKPRIIILENVEEFVTWGPLVDDGNGNMQPCKKRKGETFKAFTNALKKHGYSVDYKELKACDYGAPTIRKRFFMVARCDGKPIVWPEPTHGNGLLPYKTAADIIDWSIPCPSIFERKRPLADATCRRIAEGIKRYVMNQEKAFIVPIAHYNGNNLVHDINKPIRTITATPKGGSFSLVQAFLAKHYTGVVGHEIEKPTGTVTTIDHHSLVTSNMIKLRGNNVGSSAKEPLHTISAGGTHHAEVRAFLIKYYSEGGQWQSLNEPCHTIPTKDRIGLVTIKGELYKIVDIGMRMLSPRELFNAQGFPSDYIIDVDSSGKKLSKRAQVAKCGNSVCPPLAKAIVDANYKSESSSSLKKVSK